MPGGRVAAWRTESRRLRVVMIGPYGTAHDGIARYSSYLAEAMKHEGCDVGVVTPRSIRDSEAENVIGNLGGSRKQVRWLRKEVMKFSPDVVHVQFGVAAYGGRLPSLFRLIDALPVPTVVTAHEVTRDTDRLGWLGRRVYRRLATSADAVVVHTQAAARRIWALSPAVEVHVVPFPVYPVPTEVVGEAEIRRRFSLVDRDIILMFGFVHPHKGLSDLIAAFDAARGRCRGKLDRATLVVAGTVRRRSGLFRVMEVPDRFHLAFVKLQVRRRRLQDRTVFAGYVEDGAVAAWFRAAHAVVLPYRKIDQSSVLSLVRALGSPVIISNAGGLADETDSPWTFRAGDRQAFAELLTRLATDRPPRLSSDGIPSMEMFAQITGALYRGLRDEIGYN